VGIARALAVSPDALLLDEPFSALDPFTAEVLKQDIFRLWQKYKMTVVMVTHQIKDALELSTDVIVLSSRPGKVVENVHLHDPYPRDMRSSKMYELEDRIRTKITQVRHE
jgi:NitT/TauT family transport system ATP-binding protein